MNRLLIVSPHFPPVNAPDHQRIRAMLPHLRSLGWNATVLAVHPHEVAGAAIEPLLEKSVPSEVEVVRTGALPLRWLGALGFRTLGLRAILHTWQAGNRLLRNGDFQAVLFSTTQFSVLALGPIWKRRWNVPYMLDLQDPWLADADCPSGRPGGWKYRFSQVQAALLEPPSIRAASHILAVSSSYPKLLRDRYPDLEEAKFSVLPFCVDRTDLDIAAALGKQQHFDPADGRRHIVYTGIVEEPFLKPLRVLLEGIRAWVADEPNDSAKLAVHFIGTTYAPSPSGSGLVTLLAGELGISRIVTEHRARIPYFSALRCWHDADALVVMGSEDAAYVPSKLAASSLASRPVLVLCQEDSPAARLAAELGFENIDFQSHGAEKMVAFAIARLFMSVTPTLPKSVPKRSAYQMTQQIVQILNRMITT